MRTKVACRQKYIRRTMYFCCRVKTRPRGNSTYVEYPRGRRPSPARARVSHFGRQSVGEQKPRCYFILATARRSCSLIGMKHSNAVHSRHIRALKLSHPACRGWLFHKLSSVWEWHDSLPECNRWISVNQVRPYISWVQEKKGFALMFV